MRPRVEPAVRDVNVRWLGLDGRLKAGISIERAEAELTSLMNGLREAHSERGPVTTAILTVGGGNRANLVGDPNLSGDRTKGQKLLQWFNPQAFVQNPVGTLGTSGKYPLTGPGYKNVDFSAVKSFPIRKGFLGESQRVDFRAEFFNVFNHANFNNPNGNMSSATVGRVTSALSPRIIQFALKYMF